MDYFFAACEELRHPDLKERPVIVGTANEKNKFKGVVQTCNYNARKYGIRSGMSTFNAYKLCDKLVYLESDDKYYQEVSNRVMDMLKNSNYGMEQISIDEAVLDLGSLNYENAINFGKNIKTIINNEIKLPCTIGISFGPVYAKMICDASKPNGLGVLKESEIIDFLSNKNISKIPGVGPKTEQKMHGMRINLIKDLAAADPVLIFDRFGILGIELYNIARGVDSSRINAKHKISSIGREETLDEPTNDIDKLSLKIKKLSIDVIDEIEKTNILFKTITVKARYQDFTEQIKNRSFKNYMSSYDTLYNTAVELIKNMIKNDIVIRKVGVRVSTFSSSLGQKKL